MIHELLLHAVAAVTLAAGAGAGAGPRLDVNPGLWEVKSTSSTKMSGDVASADLSKAPPEMRARLEAMRERLKTGKPHTTVRQTCVTQADIDKGTGFEDERSSSCERKYLDRTSRHVRFQMTCGEQGGGMSSQGEFELTVQSADRVLVHGNLQMHGPQHDSASTMEITGRRLGASCGDVKPGHPRTVSGGD
jgi:hypothetical protein